MFGLVKIKICRCLLKILIYIVYTTDQSPSLLFLFNLLTMGHVLVSIDCDRGFLSRISYNNGVKGIFTH